MRTGCRFAAPVTWRLVEAGELMEVQVLDHVVVGRTRYVSLRERGMEF